MNRDVGEVAGRMELHVPVVGGTSGTSAQLEGTRSRHSAGSGPRFRTFRARSPHAEVGESSFSRLTAPESPRPEPLLSPENLSLPEGAAPAGEDGTGRCVETAWQEGRR